MQFIKDGPDIPEELLQAHEEGRVVFFCGAGISYPAGLPNFHDLVNQIYTTIGTTFEANEERAYSREQYDATLDLLERRIPGQRLTVRKALAEVLKPKLRRKNAKDTHAALLQLAHNRDGAVRLVTTNFDRIFQHVAGKRIKTFLAPFLPIPKNSRWDGVVYLHGLLPESFDESALHRLVLTSGDFGLAYLTERWAARFVSELFRNYIVCFVGYSIGDPVLRYMMDALAADRMLGEFTPQAYALGDFETGKETDKRNDWEAKGVTPILYEVPVGIRDHSALHRTLIAWAETYRDGVQGKERIISEYALTRPMASTKQDDYVGRMLWALSHVSGLPARHFAKFDPVPSLDWLEPLSEDRYFQQDLPRFGVIPKAQFDSELKFSLARRPAPYMLAPKMELVHVGSVGTRLDEVMFQLAQWLIRHLNDPRLVLWVAQRGGQLQDQLAWLINSRLDELARLEREGQTEELERILVNAPNAVPQPRMRTLWRLLLTGRVKTSVRDIDLYQWKDRFIRDGLTTTLRLELRELLTPRVNINKSFQFEVASTDSDERVFEPFDLELALTADQVHASLGDLGQSQQWQAALPSLLEDLQQLLRDALGLLRELGQAGDRYDNSHWSLPSISPHWQNRAYRDWVALIELLRDAWLATLHHDSSRTQRIAQEWFSQPYPTFKRLALFAATNKGGTTPGAWVEWLLADDGWWLWSVETQRETLRLLVQEGESLPVAVRSRLEVAILVGPPRRMFRDEITPEDWQELVAHTVWLRLAKLASGKCSMGDNATAKLADLSATHPHWQLSKDESDEFSHWMSGIGDPDYEAQREISRAPRKRRELVKWLRIPATRGPFYEDDWREVCRDKFSTAFCALCALAFENEWPEERWREALQTWNDEKSLLRSWRYVAPLLQRMPEDKLFGIAHSVTWWLEAASKVFDGHEAIFLNLCRRFLRMNSPDEMGIDCTVARAINHPVGQVTQSILHYWFRRKPEDRQGLPDDLMPIFTLLCDTSIERYRNARLLLARNAIALFRVDRVWAEEYLLPLFDWQRSATEARAAWQGFLWSPRLYRPLFAAFKADFLETARHYTDLSECGRQYAAILTYAALDPADIFTLDDLSRATIALPQEGLQEAAQALVHAIEGSGEQREQYWGNRIKPYWNNIWPKSRELLSVSISEPLARLVIAARGAFPSALETVRDWLQPHKHLGSAVYLLLESGLCGQFPHDALDLLDRIIADQPWPPRELDACLKAIVTDWPEAIQDTRYQRLVEYWRRHGRG